MCSIQALALKPGISNKCECVNAGTRDLLVLPELNALAGVWDRNAIVEADVRDMPNVWLSADHQVSVSSRVHFEASQSPHLCNYRILLVACMPAQVIKS